jgi:2-hydroxychromene-2-carboxylate isomerase
MNTVDFYFDFSCPYAYLASTQLSRITQRTGAEVVIKPMLLGGVFRANEVPQNLAASLGPAKARHNALDLERHAELWDVPYKMPVGHPFRTVEALRCLLVVGPPFQPLMDAFYRTYWVEGRDIGNSDVVIDVLDQAGHDGKAILAATQDSPIKEELRTRTNEAIDAGLFGAPGFVVNGQLYWGQDRIWEVEQALGVPRDGLPASNALHPSEFYFDFSSPFACIGFQKVERIFGASTTLMPMLLGGVFKMVGTNNVPLFSFSASKKRWVQKDMERQAEQVGFSLKWPKRFPVNSVRALRVALQIQANHEEALYPYCHTVFKAYWSEQRDIAEAEEIKAICQDLNLDGEALLEGTADPAVKRLLIDTTSKAVAAGVFGAPTTVVHAPGNEAALFWGADRMEIAHAMASGRFS